MLETIFHTFQSTISLLWDLWFQWTSNIKESSKNKIVLKALNASSNPHLSRLNLEDLWNDYTRTQTIIRGSARIQSTSHQFQISSISSMVFQDLRPRPLNRWFVIAPLTSCRWILRRDSLYRPCHPRKPLCTRGFVVLSSPDLMTPPFSHSLFCLSFANSLNFTIV